MGLLYDELEKYQSPTHFFTSPEMTFYQENVVLLQSFPRYAPFLRLEKPFDVIRANILIRAIINKKTIERAYQSKSEKTQDPDYLKVALPAYMKGISSELPFAITKRGPNKIYVPIFTYPLNRLYEGLYTEMENEPYRALLEHPETVCIDSFDYYGPSLFDSGFTNLVKVGERGEDMAFYGHSSETIYFVNSQGRLTAQLCLFDKYLDAYDRERIMERIADVVDGFYAGNRNELERRLVENKLISGRLILKIQRKREKNLSQIYGH